MKFITILCCSLVVCFGSACSLGGDDPPTEEGFPPGSGQVSASIGGVTFSASGKPAVVVTKTATGFTIDASTSTATLTLNFTGVGKIGTYTLGTGGSGTATYTSGGSTWTTSEIGGGGSVNVNSFSTAQAIGSFTFTAGPVDGTSATGTKVVTSGAFNVIF
ncbi:MAG: DUF6252 family protein [Gemmatimonas sp.]